ncbi:hypothetical protein [Streptomyces sp. CFMR 7]|uniref:hypothetical protein n=1 Tax=Streptomyces sp. CFMR 7 TaxID=1649184 RepID=UPI00119FA69E|nr:hypothetical protein [Streptomyces sp. CFMR 7]
MTTRRTLDPMTDAEPVARHVRELMAAGVSYARIAAAAGVNVSTVNHLLYGRVHRPRAKRITIRNARLILAVDVSQVTTGRVDPTGTQRRLQALMAVGWPAVHLGHTLSLHPSYVRELQRRPQVYSTTAHAMAVAYNRLWNKQPERHGISAQAANRSRNYARAKGWPPPAAWDDDVIDDPKAAPEWTGHCGTMRGWKAHREQDIPMCAACQNAFDRKQAREQARTLCGAPSLPGESEAA